MISLKNIFDIDTTASDFNDNAFRRIILHQFILIAFFTLLSYLILFLILGLNDLALLLTPFCVITACIYYLNIYKKHQIAKFTLFITLNFCVCFFCEIVDARVGLYVMYFPLICATSLVFPFKEWRKIIFFISLYIFSFIFVQIFSPPKVINIALDGNLSKVLFIFTFILAIVDMIFCIYYFVRINFKYEDALMNAKEAAEAATVAKTRFLSTMSHEIRNPMNAIMGLTDLLLEEKFEGKNLENLKAIKFSAENLYVITNDILDFSKIEAGMMTFEKVNFNIRELIQEHIKTLMPKAKNKGINILVKIDTKIPEYLIGDPVRINQILFNLTGNAIKFTSSGNVRITAMADYVTGKNISIEFSIKDTGIGIAPEKLNLVFERFTQADTDTTRKYGGTGLGLAITKKLVEMQEGIIKVDSMLGVGSSFNFTLPFEIGKKEEIQPQLYKPTIDHKLNGVRVLLAEDNLINQLVAEQILVKWGVEVDKVGSGTELIQFLKEKDYDLVLLDLQMPDMDGFEAIEIIRKGGTGAKNSKIPVIAVSADAYEETVLKARESGMDDYLNKPFLKQDLYNIILKHVSFLTIIPLSGDKENFDVAERTKYINLRNITLNLGNDKDVISDYLTLFLTSSYENLKSLESALASSDHSNIKVFAHKLKSSFRLSGLYDCADLLTLVEHTEFNIDNREKVIDSFVKVKYMFDEAVKEIESLKLAYA